MGSHPDIRSRSRAESLIAAGHVTSQKQVLKSSFKLTEGLTLEVLIPEALPNHLVPLERPLDIVFEDSDLLVVNKPAGLVVHPAAGHAQDTLVNMLLAHTKDLSMGFGENRPGIVHRLDRDTSGLLVIAKNDFTHHALSEKFQKRDLHRVYHAICLERPPKIKGTLQSFLARHPFDRKKFASVKNTSQQIIRDQLETPNIGKWAITHYDVLDTLHSGVSYVQLKLETGRTHQIRVHLSEIGCPIAADALYGALRKLKSVPNPTQRQILTNFPRVALHARELGFIHPRTNKWLSFSVNWPKDLLPLIEKLEFPKWEKIRLL